MSGIAESQHTGAGAALGTRAEDYVLVQGIRDTRETLAAWHARRWRILVPWFAGALAIAFILLAAVWVIAKLSTPDPSAISLPGVTRDSTLQDAGPILYRNSLVLALHAMACVAGFIAGSSLPQVSAHKAGIWKRVHDLAGPAAITFVAAATTFSLSTQAYALGLTTSNLSSHLNLPSWELLLTLTPHAIPELVALFLPLAAWILASRRGDWHELLAATIATTAISAPVLVIAAFIEVYVSPHVILASRAAFG